MSDLDLFKAYRRTVASTGGDEVAWWYLGQVYAVVDGFPEVLALNVATLMFYRTRDVDDDTFSIEWTEIGCFLDAISGTPGARWINPVSGVDASLPNKFMDGPAVYTIKRKGDGIDVHLVQTGATVERITLTPRVEGSRIFFTQDEYKRRNIAGGDQPGPDASAHTQLWFAADLEAARDPGQASVASTGTYSFELQTLPAWGGFDGLRGRMMVRGITHKADYRHCVNRVGWDALKLYYPEFFDSDRLKPVWP